jgi:hypothetical protein
VGSLGLLKQIPDDCLLEEDRDLRPFTEVTSSIAVGRDPIQLC